ncbi:uncharacterized protein LOC129976688 [Argiope bruennichi]|uniref:uncharacterized protein LOC129976688 n=1 Tax=Argiope bruennichi TaxID=94029 RepID=UPI0024941C14|nr:uncharacterized protein LOC129976688 [Argiope bruennichi]
MDARQNNDEEREQKIALYAFILYCAIFLLYYLHRQFRLLYKMYSYLSMVDRSVLIVASAFLLGFVLALISFQERPPSHRVQRWRLMPETNGGNQHDDTSDEDDSYLYMP